MTYNEVGLTVGIGLLFGSLVIGCTLLILYDVKQYRKGRCVVCKDPVDWDLVKEDFEDVFDQADRHGLESLTENQQVVCEGKCCSWDCYEELCTVIIEV